MTALKGAGLLKGLGVTLRTMSRPAATRQYPHVRPDLPARTRGVIALIEENCTVCMLCARECPDWCIYIDSHKEVVAPKEGGRARTRNLLDRFAIDFALCMYCGICVEVCPFDALHWSPEFEYAEHAHEALTHEMDRLREWAYTVPAPDPLEEGAVEPKELEAARKAQEAARAKAAAQAEAQAQAVAAAPAPAPAAAPQAEEVHVEPGIDQETFDRLVAAGEPDRTARAKAKAAYMRKAKAAARAGAAEAPAAGTAPAAEAGSAEPASVDAPAAALAAPETAPPAPAAAGTSEVAEPAPDARAPEARSPEGEPTASATAAPAAEPEHLEIEIDKATYDRLIAAGESDRTARAKAKAAYARRLRAAAKGEQQ
jgi:NADH-quinone oxidoreductase subunit I